MAKQINLNGVSYNLAPRSYINKQAISPWKAQIRQTGGLEYSDFSQAEMEEYSDFRNGIGRNRGLGSDARLQWSEGIDFTIDGQAVLDPLVNTAEYNTWEAVHNYSVLNFVIPVTPNGYCYECTTDAGSSAAVEPAWPVTLGNTVVDDGITWTCRAYLAPIKIIDFQDSTYVIQNSRILKWDGTNLDCVDNSLPNPIDAIVITDATDEYLVISSAIASIYTTDGTTWNFLHRDLLLYTEVDANAKLTVTATKATGALVDGDEDVYLYEDKGVGYFDALDVDFELYIASTSENSSGCGIAITNTVNDISGLAATDISVVIDKAAGTNHVQLHRGAGVASDSYVCSADTLYYCTLTRVAGNDSCSVTIYSDSTRALLLDTLTVAGFGTGKFRYAYGFINYFTGGGDVNFDGYVQNLELGSPRGYLANYENRLYSISTDGSLVTYSASENMDKYSSRFNLTGNFGTVYDFYQGKLLSDGTPTLYFNGTQGLYTVDTTNQLAYQQEVSYPPLTYAGHAGLYWNANVWVATGYGILKIASSVAAEVGPNQDDGLPATYQGYIYDMVTVNNWLVYCVKAGATEKSSILKLNSSYGGNLQVYTSTNPHKVKDSVYAVTAPIATNTATLYALLNEIKSYYNSHRASTTYHLVADATNIVALADATTEATAVALANEIKLDFNAHRSQSGVHVSDDASNEVTTADSTTEATAITLANEIKTDYNNHVLSGGNAIDCLWHSPSSLHPPGRLWFGEGTNVKYMMFLDTTSNPKQVSTFEYANDSGYGNLPIFRKLATISKTALGVAAITKSCDANEYIELFYGLNGAAPTTSKGTFKTSPRPTILTFNSGLGTAFYTIQFAIKLYRGGTPTNSPELESLMFYYIPVPATISAWQFNIQCTEDTSDELITQFEALRDTQTLVVFYPTGDTAKASYNVKITSLKLRFYSEEQRSRQGYITIVAEEVFNG